MDISKKYVKYGNQKREGKNSYFKLFMALLVVFVGLFFSYKLNARADDPPDEQHYGEWITESDRKQYYYMKINGEMPKLDDNKQIPYLCIFNSNRRNSLSYSIDESNHLLRIQKGDTDDVIFGVAYDYDVSFLSVKQMVLVSKNGSRMLSTGAPRRIGTDLFPTIIKDFTWDSGSEKVDLNEGYCNISFFESELTEEEKQVYGEIVQEGNSYHYYMHIEGKIPSNDISIYDSSEHDINYIIHSSDNHCIELDLTDKKTLQDGIIYIKRGSLGFNTINEIDFISYDQNSYREISTQYKTKDLLPLSYFFKSGTDDKAVNIRDNKYDAIHFGYLNDSENPKDVIVNSDFLNCTADDVNRDTSVYRVFRRDGEEKKIKLAGYALSGNNNSNSGVIAWMDSVYTRAKSDNASLDDQNIRYAVEMVANSRLSFYYKEKGYSKATGTDYFNLKVDGYPRNDPLDIGCIARAPTVRVLNLNDSETDITSEPYFTDNYTADLSFELKRGEDDDHGNHVYKFAPVFNIQNKNNKYEQLLADDFSLEGANLESYDPVTGGLEINYDGCSNIDIGIKPFKRLIWVGSNNVEEPWMNDSLREGYDLKVKSGDTFVTTGISEVESDDDFHWGAWYYKYYEPIIEQEGDIVVADSSFEFQMSSKDGYEFTERTDNVSGIYCTISGVSHDANNKATTFTVESPTMGAPGVQVNGEQYTTYTNTYKSADAGKRLSDMVTLKLNFSETGLVADDDGNYTQTWTLASPLINHKFEVKDGYGIKNSVFGLGGLNSGEIASNPVPSGNYTTTRELVLSLEKRDHVITVSGIEDAPKLIIKNLNDSNKDITDKTYFTDNYTATSKFVINDNGDWAPSELTIKNDNNIYAQLAKDDFSIETAGVTLTDYNPTTGDLTLSNYVGGDLEVGIKPFKRYIWVGGSNTEDPWKNTDLPGHYVLKRNSESGFVTTGISQAPQEDAAKGAWYYKYYEAANDSAGEVNNSSLTFQFIGTKGYEFSDRDFDVAAVESGETSISDKELKYADKDSDNNIGDEHDPAVKEKNCVQFTVTPGVGEPKIQVKGQKYTEYKNTFKYKLPGYKLGELIKMNGMNDPNSEGDYVQTWTAGSALNFDYTFNRRDNYIIKPSEFEAEISPNDGVVVSKGVVTDEYEDQYSFGLSNLQQRDYVIVIGNCMKAVRKMNFSCTGKSFSVTDDKNSVYAREGNDYIASGIYMKLAGDDDGSAWLEYHVKFKNSDGRQRFIDDKNEIANEIKSKNGQDLKDCSVTVSGDNSEIELDLKLAYSNAKTEYTINFPDDVIVEYRHSNVKFDIDLTRLEGSIYHGDVSNGITVRRDDGSVVNLSLINGHLRSYDNSDDMAYDKIKYTMTIDPDVIDLSQLKLSLDTDKSDPGAEVEFIKKEKNEIVFKINHGFGAGEYRENLTFYFNADEVMSKRRFVLCDNTVLYETGLGTGSTKNKIATAEYGAVETDVDVDVPVNGENTFLAQYVDYSQSFDLDNIEIQDQNGNPVPAEGAGHTYTDGKTTVVLGNDVFNTVKIKIVDSSNNQAANDDGTVITKIVCKAPIPTSPSIRFNPIDGAKYYNLAEDGKIDLNSTIEGVINVPTDQNYSFAVKCDNGYDSAALSVKANRNEFVDDDTQNFVRKDVEDENGKYSICTIKKGDAMQYPYVITGSVTIKQLSIRFDRALKDDFGTCEYIYNGSSVDNISVIYAEGIEFSVNLPEKCNQSNIKVVFKPETGDEITLERVNGKYLLNNIVSSGRISIDKDSLSINKYPVTFLANDRAYYRTRDGGNLSGTQTVEYGGGYSFKVYANSGYTLDGAAVSLKYSDGMSTTLEPDGSGVYSISNIRQPCTVSVDNVEDLAYNVTLEPALGVTYLNGSDNVIKDTIRVKHGHNFEFAVALDDAYDDSKAGMYVTVNDGKSSKSSAQKLASGRYVINNVVEDITIKVGNVKKNTYTVTLTGAEGIDYYNSGGGIITGDNSVEHHSDFSFKVELYPAYADSNITVMLGDTPMSANESGYYTISKISENKTVTVVGIEQSDETELINKINSLPDSVENLSDVDDVIAATKQYEALSDAKKALVGNIDKLRELQEQVKAFHHVSNDVRIEGVDWYIKLYAIPITEDVDACGRIYKKLNNEYILSLYNVYLWNTLEDTRYVLPEGESAVITLPTPDMTYFEKPTAIHEKDTGKIDFLALSLNGDSVAFQTDSFSPMGVIANRTLTPGRSSLLDAADAQLDAISQFAASVFGNDTKKVYNNSSSDLSDMSDGTDNGLNGVSGDDDSGNIDEKFKSINNRVTPAGSALRLILVLMILLLIVSLIVFFVRRRKNQEE